MSINNIFNLPITKIEVGTSDYIMIHMGRMINIFDPFLKKIICRGEYFLHIKNAAWRLREGGKIIFSSSYSYDDELVDKFCNYLIGKQIVSYNDISERDFEIGFNNGAVFESFFLNFLHMDEHVMWVLYNPDGEIFYHFFIDGQTAVTEKEIP